MSRHNCHFVARVLVLFHLVFISLDSAWAQQSSVPLPQDVNTLSTSVGTSETKVKLPWSPAPPGEVSQIYDYSIKSNSSRGPGNQDQAPPSSLGRTLRSLNQQHLFGLRYSISEKWGVRVVGAAIDNRFTVQKKDGSGEEDVFVQGMGDMKLQGVYSVYRDETHRFEVSGGTTIPTGATDLMGPNGKPLSARNQLGSGTFDLAPSVSYAFTKGGWELSDRIEGTFHLGKNSSGWTNGDTYSNQMSVSYVVFPFLQPILTANLQNHQRRTTDNPEAMGGSRNLGQKRKMDQDGTPLPGPSSPQDTSFGGPGWAFSSNAALRSRLPLGKSSPIRASIEVGVPVYNAGKSETGMTTEWFAASSISSTF